MLFVPYYTLFHTRVYSKVLSRFIEKRFSAACRLEYVLELNNIFYYIVSRKGHIFDDKKTEVLEIKVFRWDVGHSEREIGYIQVRRLELRLRINKTLKALAPHLKAPKPSTDSHITSIELDDNRFLDPVIRIILDWSKLQKTTDVVFMAKTDQIPYFIRYGFKKSIYDMDDSIRMLKKRLSLIHHIACSIRVAIIYRINVVFM